MENLNGIIILDKPSNYDSHQITAVVKELLHAEKIGHGGTLDPKVTGILIILLGKATRLSDYFSKVDKEYVGIMNIHKDMEIKNIKEATEKFIGKIRQTPPIRSAVKRQEREREIYEFEIMQQDGKNVLFRARCESGTYIRKLVHDFGIALETGAHMLELRRTKDGIFSENDCVSMYDIEKAAKEKDFSKILLPIEIVAKNMPKIIVKDECIEKLQNGCPIFKKFILSMDKFKNNDIIAILNQQQRLIEIAQAVFKDDIIAMPKTVLGNA